MGSKMLIDAAHPEETRVVVVRGNNRIEELDYEASARKRLRGNIYLAKVTRVEPSLQAAFVDYGGNRHGFLAFNEIHPDYYQIPVADREALLREEEEEEVEEAQADTDVEAAADTDPEADGDDDDADIDGNDAPEGERAASVESVGSGDALEEVPRRAQHRKRNYKIQEVIKRRQIILVQVVKEERGNKGAALTTYLSLAGRYCVLMPNTARGGGISRKITDGPDRKRLKDVAKAIEVPMGMGLIVRTAGASRTKAEIKRDYDYLLRLWENVRDLTLSSNAPSLVYEEGSLIKRAIRDLYTKEMDEIQVEGEEGYKEAKEFMRMLMPSHARHVKLYKDGQPLFMKHRIENQLDVLFSSQVQLPSGGYIVINQTEALVAIDVNSGKATREHNIEDTALRTNTEAAEEVARQMRLRDLAGLIVIDFIDMEERRNNRSVERRLKERLKSDRARIQVGRISHFGLLEMSRQRMRSGVLESSTRVCPTCDGRGFVRSITSASLQVLRGIEEHLQRHAKDDLAVQAPLEVVLYILNQKRDHVLSLEATYGIAIYLEANDKLGDSEFAVERALDRGYERRVNVKTVQIDSPFIDTVDDDVEAEPDVEDEDADTEARSADTEAGSDEDGAPRKRRRRRRGRRGSRNGRAEETAQASGQEGSADAALRDEDGADDEDGDGDGDTAEAADSDAPRSRRGRRGSRRRGRGTNGSTPHDGLEADSEEQEPQTEADDDAPQPVDEGSDSAEAEADAIVEAAPDEETPAVDDAPAKAAPKGSRRRVRKPAKEKAVVAASDDEAVEETAADAVPVNGIESPVAEEPDAAAAQEAAEPEVESAGEDEPADEPDLVKAAAEDTDEGTAEEAPEAAPPAPPRPTRRGWWQRRL